MQQPRVLIEGNLIHDIGRFSAGESGCSPARLYYQIHDHGIYADGDAPAPETFDFHLTGGSPAVDTGLTIPNVTRDFAGVARPQGASYDIGACELVP